ncbi:DUF342 domain-containing protein [Teredinibacter haidensis]|uniref:DUF342 domain-containing protein n=1 Tax=Teredinibacter haidensis TaxID=2731755 RepID=UPI000948CED9|nr:FapA family protein [Teredinibacter haidensis]
MESNNNNATPTTSPRYRLEYDEKTSRVMGIVEPAKTAAAENNDERPTPQPAITQQSINEHLKSEGFADHFYPPNSVQLFLKKVQRFENGRYVLAERRDAKISISISHDKTTARVQTDRAWGGQKLNPEWIEEEVEKARLDGTTLDKEKLDQLRASKEPVDLIIANAILPKHGTNAKMESLLESKTIAEKDTDSSKVIDQLDVYDFTVVQPGDKLMRRVPATSGEDGLDVKGSIIRANAGIDVQFNKPFEGVELAEDDENLLIAAIKGHPVYSNSGVKVDALMVLEDVDIHSGHIDYDGSLMIKHNVEPGLHIKVSGDIFIKGSVTKATIVAGGSITVSGGVNADDIDDEHSCHLEAGGDVNAKFFHHTSVVCKGDLNAAEYVMQCKVLADGYINAGQERGRGCLIGGHCTSHSGINAKVLGSEAYVTTTLFLGEDNELQREVAALNHKIKRRTAEEEQLLNILKKIQAKGTPTTLGQTILDKARKVEETVQLIQEKINLMQMRLDELKPRLTVNDNLAVNVSKQVYPNVVINILGHAWSCEDAKRHCSIKLEGERVFAESL